MKQMIPFILMLLSFTTQAQTIFKADARNKADLTVFVTPYVSQADLLVFVEDAKNKATGNEGRWFFTDAKSKADASIFIVDAKNKADLVICYVSARNKAGWKNPCME